MWELVGGTPLLKIQTLSELTGCEIMAKLEYLNPGGSIKDRTAKAIITQAEKAGQLGYGGCIVEGTAGNTGLGLALLGIARGYRVIIFMPNNQTQEKVSYLESLGAEVKLVPPCPFSDQNHFYHQARRFSETHSQVFWADQFENLSNFEAHFNGTGPEIWEQCRGKIDYFVSAAGTGGTIAGVSQFLKKQNPAIQIVLADPFGSGLYEYFKSGSFKAEGASITEGIGIMRLTANFKRAQIDEALRISDAQMLDTLFIVSKKEGLFPGLSSALNLAAAVEIGMRHQGKGLQIVTVVADHGTRYISKIPRVPGPVSVYCASKNRI